MAQVESMTPDLMGIISRYITPDFIRSTASELGEDRERTASALSTSVPSVLTALSDVASSDTGAAHLKETIDETRHMSARESTDITSLMHSNGMGGNGHHHGHSAALLENELGSRSSSIVEAVARTTGIKNDSARKILGGMTTVAVTAIGKTAGGTGSGSLRTLLGSQRAEWMKKLPGPVASLFNGNGASTTSTRYEHAPARAYERTTTVERVATGPAIRQLEPHRERPAWLIPVIIAALALLAIPFLSRRHRAPVAPQPPQATRVEAPTPRPATPPPVATEPVKAAPRPAVAPPVEAPPVEPSPVVAAPAVAATTQELGAFLAGSEGTVPKRFALSPLNFQFGSTKLTAGSMSTVDDLAGLLNANPGAQIRVESFTDNIGTPAANDRLSTERSDAIKSLLTARGVDESRIAAVGMGEQQPAAPNDTAEGRALNRRTEFVVTGR